MKNKKGLKFLNCLILTILFVLVLTFSSLAETSPNGIIEFLTDWERQIILSGHVKG